MDSLSVFIREIYGFTPPLRIDSADPAGEGGRKVTLKESDHRRVGREDRRVKTGLESAAADFQRCEPEVVPPTVGA